MNIGLFVLKYILDRRNVTNVVSRRSRQHVATSDPLAHYIILLSLSKQTIATATTTKTTCANKRTHYRQILL